ncbi:hypothetical protein [Lachnoanaerobaculum gingivalis]
MNKQAMLNYIFDYADSLMNASGYTILPYYDLDNSTMNRIQSYFSSDINSDNIVALISTSVFDPGKTGIVFTNYAVYTRDWGILPETDINFLYEYDTASFTSSNDFQIGVLTYIMERLFEISINDTAKEIAKDFKDIAQSFKNWLDS